MVGRLINPTNPNESINIQQIPLIKECFDSIKQGNKPNIDLSKHYNT